VRDQLDGFQTRVATWLVRVFGVRMLFNKQARALRLVEEAVEYAQAEGVELQLVQDVAQLVYSRPAGDPYQELGGVGVTWLGACAACRASADVALDVELTRIESKPAELFRARDATKVQPREGTP
jgi:Tfp pilus assembly protein PilV